MKRLSDLLPTYLGQDLDRRGDHRRLTELWARWDEILDPYLKDLTPLARPLGHKDDTLYVGAEDSAALQELTYAEWDILDAVNGFLGKKIFDRVRLDLLRGKTSLEGTARQLAGERRRTPPLAMPQPGRVGGLGEGFAADSPVGRCYRAYVRLAQEREAEHGANRAKKGGQG